LVVHVENTAEYQKILKNKTLLGLQQKLTGHYCGDARPTEAQQQHRPTTSSAAPQSGVMPPQSKSAPAAPDFDPEVGF
jgi:hypothetical protein